MSYLEEFQLLTEENNLTDFLHLWEEFCTSDHADVEDLDQILALIKESKAAAAFGRFAETALPLWSRMQNETQANNAIRLLLDLQTTNSMALADTAIGFLKKNYGSQKDFQDKLRIVGLLTKNSFQGAISNFELLSHMEKGNFVFHSGGWGVGEVVEISLLREHVKLEFEGIASLKDLSFENAFRNLIPLNNNHFLARRFGNPDLLEREGKEDHIALIKLLLRDLGPKTAQEIKDELCDLVIPSQDWTQWWGAARIKIKKDVQIKSPRGSKDPFVLSTRETSHEERLAESLAKTHSLDKKIEIIYHFTRDFPALIKTLTIKDDLKNILQEGLQAPSQNKDSELSRNLQIYFLLEDLFAGEFEKSSISIIQDAENVSPILELMDIVAMKKRALVLIRKHRKDWGSIFLHLLCAINQNILRDYIFKTLYDEPDLQPLLLEKLRELLHIMNLYPDAFFWYFQKIVAKDPLFEKEQENKSQFLEAFLILLHFVETNAKHKDLLKKMYHLLVTKRYATIREFIEGSSEEFLKEFLLLSSKCHCFTKQDLRIFNSLAEVVQPGLDKKKKSKKPDYDVIWTTHDGLKKVQERIQHIGTVETVDNAKEIEAARSLGDLRENSEYKYALERRARLQGELKNLSSQLNKARILTKEDIIPGCIGVGTIVELKNEDGKSSHYTILGPWDADPEKNILSFQSRFAEAMTGHKEGEKFDFQGEFYTIEKVESIFS